MVQARFINDTKTVDVHGENQETTVNVQSKSEVMRIGLGAIHRHDTLSNRDLPNQHPISAITGLQEALNRLDTFVFEQSVASDTWVIEHNLGRYPSVEIVDTAGNKFFPAVQWVNENKCIVTMNGATKGKAFLN